MKILYSLLFLITPWIFTSVNSELFELPKMYFLYGSTLIILIFHLVGYLKGKNKLFQPTFLDWPLLLFLVSQIVSTFFSIDLHTSIFGYYSRLNGGLLSLFTYALLYWILAVHLDSHLKNRLIAVSLFSGLVVAVYGIAQHFGIDKNIWVQDVQNRVFSTLGQPNWLAAYLCILLPLSLDRFFNSKSRLSSIYYLSLIVAFYLCLLFTKSKSGIIAAVISLGVYFLITFFKKNYSRYLLIIASIPFIVFSLFVNNPIKDFLFPSKIVATPVSDTTLNITPSGDIRKIVWKGAFQLWQQFPLFGTGPETFAYSYYWIRPAAHNLTSEWDFLYNKAHNEYLNYLATTGSFGFLTYLSLILVTGYWLLHTGSYFLFSSYLSILITNSAGFSVVVVSLFFFLIPVFSLTAPPVAPFRPHFLPKTISFVIISLSCFLFIKNIYFYLADITYAQAETLDSNQKYSSADNYLHASLNYRSDEPVYLIKGADLAAKMAIITGDKQYVDKSLTFMDKATQISPFNLNFWKEKAQTYYYLSTIDPQYYLKALDALTKATKLAPTDARSFYMLGQFYENIKAADEAVANFQTAVSLKPNYDHVYYALGEIYFQQQKYDLAKTNFQQVLDIVPANSDARDYLNRIATASAKTK